MLLNRKTFIGVVAVMLAAVLAVWSLRPHGDAPRGALEAAKPIKLRVRFPIPTLRATMAPFVAAKRMAYYSAAGLDVEFRYGGSGTNPVSMVVGGQDDIGIPVGVKDNTEQHQPQTGSPQQQDRGLMVASPAAS